MAFWERMEKLLNKGIETSKEVVDKAKIKAKDLGDKGLLKYEMMQLEKQAERRLVQLGKTVYEGFVKNKKDHVSQSDASIQSQLCELEDIEKRINQREEESKKYS